MQLPIEPSLSAQKIADEYHAHLQQARLSKREHHLLPRVRKGDRIHGEEAWPIAIYLDHIRSAHNVGSIIRTVEALSLGSIYFSPQTPFITNKQVQDTAMGTITWLKCYQGIALNTLPRPILVLETGEEAISLYDMIFPSSFTLVVGNEEYGCSNEALELADELVEIPLRGHKNSLNVANAFAIAAGEIQRQKGHL
jgi:tRNA G18 (ribose-2'-O)-methylase SpoU